MKEIQLTQGKVALVDDCDFELVSKYKWQAIKCSRSDEIWYAVHSVGPKRQRRQMRMHRLILGAGNGQKVDHRDRDGLNNTRKNLRIATVSGNACNRRHRKSTSEFKGVYFEKRLRKYRAACMINGDRRYLGCFSDPKQAALAYDAAATELHGEFARTNKMLGLLCQ